MADEPKDEGAFLSRWSRRKAGRDESDEAAAPTQPEAPETEEAERQAAEDENRKAAEAVDLEKLSYESDYSLFLKPGVPGVLRDRALRRLWRSNPLLANLDGLNDYDEDFTTPAGAAAKVVKTLWKVHGGYLDDPPSEQTAEVSEASDADAAARPQASTSVRLPEEASREGVEALGEEEAEPQKEDETVEGPREAQEEGDHDQATRLEETPRVGLRARLDFDAFKRPEEA